MYRAPILFLALTLSPALAAAQQPCTADARAVVQELYRHMLERAADSNSTVWVQQLQNGRTVRNVVREIAKSDENGAGGGLHQPADEGVQGRGGHALREQTRGHEHALPEIL